MTRKIILPQPSSVKDETGAYRKPDAPVPVPVDTPSIDDLSLDSIAGKLIYVLYRETKSLLEETALGAQLSRENKQALVNYLKLVKELQKMEKDDLDKLSDEELEKIANDKS